ncbi:MAG: hypothetical protein FI729_06125 [SAR202 cluster bacterium]|nr:hypothetical protein [SAR202 cluster bacterium]|tara:strand:+ start:27657 stop:28400 length:744 start_codon:yes stop_codon:yes gene_type:complete
MYFEKGEETSPKGHALVYFRDRNDTDSIFATYIIALPISVDVSKYIPPMFASQMQGMTTQDLNGFAFPPMPEKMDNIESVRNLAEIRGDDLIDGGTGNLTDPMESMNMVNELQQEYTKLWENSLANQNDEQVLDSVKDVIYEFMGEPDKLSELSKLVGKLRFASEGHEGFYNRSLIEEVESEILSLARYLPVNYNIKSLIQCTKLESDSGSVLAQLYLERCYKLYEEDYIELQSIEDKIKSFESDQQ